MRRIAFAVTFLAATVCPTAAQHALGGSGPYDPSIPTPRSVLGYELGDRFTPHHLIVRYAEAVANASPRVRVDTTGMTYEGRELLLVTVASEENMRRLAEIRAQANRLADPRGASDAELQRLVAGMPAIAHLAYTVHGNEASGAEASMAVMYELAASRDPETTMLLDSVVVLIDPLQNPDGHERHAQDVMRRRGAFGPDPYPGALEQSSAGWEGARTNHYLFDLNRDWIVHAHPETRARMAVLRGWYPHVSADLHEMGSSSTYFFAPPMDPVNANVHETVRRGWQMFARGNADAFAEQGWGFFTREGYDEFYPGYGPSWGIFTGAVGMTYEEASSNGGAIRRDDGSILTLEMAASHHYTASMATIRTLATNRTARLRDYLAFRRGAISESGFVDTRTIFLARDAQGRADSLVHVLDRHDIEVGELTEAVQVRATEYGDDDAERVRLPAGTYVVDLAQPNGVLAFTLLDPDPDFTSEFVEEEMERRRTGQGNRFYDQTAWSLNYLYRVPAWHSTEAVSRGAVRTPPAELITTTAAPARAGYAYVFEPGTEASVRMLGGLLADSVRVRYARHWFRVGQNTFPEGAFVVLVNRNGPDLHETIMEHAQASGAGVVTVNNALVDAGTDLGSNSVEAIPIPRVALVGGEGVSSYSHGSAWYTFEQLMHFPVTRVPLDGLAGRLADFNVVVLPSAFGISDNTAEALQAWVRDGNVLITLDGATGWLASDRSGLASLRRRDSDDDEGDDDEPRPASLSVSVPGAIVRAHADTLSPLMAGVTDAELAVLFSGSTVYELPDGYRPGEAVIRLETDPEQLRLGGFMWPESPEHVAGGVWLWTERAGRGRVIGFAGDPNYRAMWRGLLPIFANAVFLGGAF